MEKNILNVKESGQGRVGQIFKMKEIVGVSKKASAEPHAIKDPKTGHLLVANKDIQKATLNYCVDNLKNKVTDTEAQEFITLRNALVEEKMNKSSEDTLNINKEDFNVVLKRFQSKQTKSYDFLTKSSRNYLLSLHFVKE